MSTSRSLRTSRSLLAAVAMLAACGSLAAFAAGCPGSISDPDAFLDFEGGTRLDGMAGGSASSCGDVTATIFTPTCATAGCHSTASMMNGLDLQAADVFTRLVGKTATGGAGVLLDPGGDPTKSVLYEKLTSTPPFGSQMPLGGPYLSAASLACVASWITMEAAASGGSGDAAASDGNAPSDAMETTDAEEPNDAGESDDGGSANDAGNAPDARAPVDSGAPDSGAGG